MLNDSVKIIIKFYDYIKEKYKIYYIQIKFDKTI